MVLGDDRPRWRMTRIAIVGHEHAKFTPVNEAVARRAIRSLLSWPKVVLVSGRSPLGGIDVYAEEIADEMGVEKDIYPAATSDWETGFKPRNLQIAHNCDEAYCLVVRSFPDTYTGRRFPYCYHCKGERPDHIKSGGCWTVMRAQERGVPGHWIII